MKPDSNSNPHEEMKDVRNGKYVKESINILSSPKKIYMFFCIAVFIALFCWVHSMYSSYGGGGKRDIWGKKFYVLWKLSKYSSELDYEKLR